MYVFDENKMMWQIRRPNQADRLHTWGLAPPGPVTSMALGRPSSDWSTTNSTCSPSASERKPSVTMLVCAGGTAGSAVCRRHCLIGSLPPDR